MNFIHGMNIPINHEDPMKGIFYRMFKYIDIIEKGMAYSLQSSIYNGDSNNYQNASYLLRRKETPGWLSNNTPNSNFELIFPNFLFALFFGGLKFGK